MRDPERGRSDARAGRVFALPWTAAVRESNVGNTGRSNPDSETTGAKDEGPFELVTASCHPNIPQDSDFRFRFLKSTFFFFSLSRRARLAGPPPPRCPSLAPLVHRVWWD